MNMAWKYSRGEWEEIPDPLAWADGENFEDVLERAGYCTHVSVRWGHEYDEVACDLYSPKGNNKHYPVLLSVCLDCNSVEYVFIYDFPSLMQFFKEYVPVFVLSGLGVIAEDAGKTLRQAFRAWHGHDADAVCRECDPEAYRAQQDRKRKRLSSVPDPS